METDVLDCLVGLFEDWIAHQSSVKIITALVELGTLLYLACTKADRPAEDFRCKMVETNVLTRLVGLLQDSRSYVRQSSVEIITTLATFGALTYFGVYKV